MLKRNTVNPLRDTLYYSIGRHYLVLASGSTAAEGSRNSFSLMASMPCEAMASRARSRKLGGERPAAGVSRAPYTFYERQIYNKQYVENTYHFSKLASFAPPTTLARTASRSIVRRIDPLARNMWCAMGASENGSVEMPCGNCTLNSRESNQPFAERLGQGRNFTPYRVRPKTREIVDLPETCACSR